MEDWFGTIIVNRALVLSNKFRRIIVILTHDVCASSKSRVGSFSACAVRMVQKCLVRTDLPGNETMIQCALSQRLSSVLPKGTE